MITFYLKLFSLLYYKARYNYYVPVLFSLSIKSNTFGAFLRFSSSKYLSVSLKIDFIKV